MFTLFATLALVRLQNEPAAKPLAQHFTDQVFGLIDAGLREAGVGDTTVPKRMRKLAGDFYGRLNAYADAMEAGDRPVLAAAIVRNTGIDEAFALRLAEIAVATVERQRGLTPDQISRSDSWVAV